VHSDPADRLRSPETFQLFTLIDASNGMNVQRTFATKFALVLGGLLSCSGLVGCQSNIGGQTLPSAWYLRDDVQYFPAGPETLLPNTIRAHEEYRAQQEAALDADYLSAQ